jgi:negative regulator of flagellin synthesis FlgM
MTMKIHGHQASLDTESTNRTDATRKVDATVSERATRAERKTDSVEVSADARLLTDAMKAAGDAPDIRQDVVERMRRLMESGELGRDSTRLAERVIDHLLEK